jgi:holo-[acyl-carrier protein] synthase
MIVGLGIDVAEVKRIAAVIEAQKERFLRRVFTLDEVAYCEQFKNRYERYAGRFAVKEAAMKALGTGWSRGVRWVDVEVVRQRGGRPSLVLKGEAKKIADAMGVRNIAVSITHTADQAVAQVIFES